MNLQALDGKTLIFQEIDLRSGDGHLDLFCKCICEGKFFTVCFRNVSQLKMSAISYPIVISGFEMIDHLQNGWESRVRYLINDFEEDTISFFCESFSE